MRKTARKLVSLAIALILQLTLTVICVPILFAASPDIGNETQLSQAIDEAQNGETLTLTASVTIDQDITINKDITIDTRNYSLTVFSATLTCNAGTIKGSAAPLKVKSGGCLDLNNGASVLVKTGDAIQSDSRGVIRVEGGRVNGSLYCNQGAEITVSAGEVTGGIVLNKFTDFNLSGGIVNGGIKAASGTISFTGGTVNGDEFGIRAESGVSVNISDGTINANNGIGIYLQNDAKADIKGGTINAKYGVVMMGGSTLSIVTSYSKVNGVYNEKYKTLISPLPPIIHTKVGRTEQVQVNCTEWSDYKITPDTPYTLSSAVTQPNTFTVTPSQAGSFLLALKNYNEVRFPITLRVPVIVTKGSNSSSSAGSTSSGSVVNEELWKSIQEQSKFTPRPTIPETGAEVSVYNFIRAVFSIV